VLLLYHSIAVLLTVILILKAGCDNIPGNPLSARVHSVHGVAVLYEVTRQALPEAGAQNSQTFNPSAQTQQLCY